ncbi:MAG: glycosyltransferase [Bacteroidota bacterium]
MSKNKLKVCMLTTDHSPLDERIFYKECKSLAKSGYDVSLICSSDKEYLVYDMGRKSIINPDKAKEFTIDDIKIYCIQRSLTTFQKALNKLQLSNYVDKFIKKGIALDADIYHAHEPKSLFIGLQIQKRTGAKLVYDSHESWNFNDPVNRFYRNRWMKNLKNLITVNELIGNEYQRFNHNIKSCILYNTSHPDFFPPVFEEKKLATPIIVFEGVLSFDRGLKEILEVFNLLKNDFPKIKFRIIGEGSGKEKAYLEAKIKAYSLERNIEQTGWVDYTEVGKYLKDCSIGLITNTFTYNNIFSSPNKLFNYMTYGIAIVAFDLPFITKIIGKHKCGKTVFDRSVQKLYSAIKLLITEKDLLKDYCRNSFMCYRTYNWLNEEQKLLDFYEDIIENKFVKNITSPACT